MFLSHDQHVIQAFSPYAAPEAFAKRIGFGCAIRRFQDFNVAALCHSRESVAKFAITIANQEAWRLTVRRGFAQLLCDPGIRGMRRDVKMNDSPGSKFNDEEEIDLRKKRSITGKESQAQTSLA